MMEINKRMEALETEVRAIAKILQRMEMGDINATASSCTVRSTWYACLNAHMISVLFVTFFHSIKKLTSSSW